MSLDIVVQFVERKISTDDFIDNLYNNEELEKILSENIAIPPFTNNGSLYLYLLSQDLNTPAGLLNSVSAMKEYLEKKKIKFEKNNEAEKLFSLMIRVQPKWVDIPDWYMKKLLEISGEKKGRMLEEFIKENIKLNFRYIKKPPKWLQSPQWLYNNEEPLLFVSQIDITDIRHDNAQLYVFLDEKNNKFYLTEQIV